MPDHFLNKHLDVVADEKEFLMIAPVGRVHSEFCRGQTENEPALAGVDMGKFEHISQKGTIRRRVGAIDNGVCTANHVLYQMYGTRR